MQLHFCPPSSRLIEIAIHFLFLSMICNWISFFQKSKSPPTFPTASLQRNAILTVSIDDDALVGIRILSLKEKGYAGFFSGQTLLFDELSRDSRTLDNSKLWQDMPSLGLM